MVKNLVLLSALLLPRFAIAQTAGNSCQLEFWHRVQQKRRITLSEKSKAAADSVLLVLVDTLPPVDWWNPFLKRRENGVEQVRENPAYEANKNVRYQDQRLVRIINTTSREIEFTKPDRCLMLGLQARDSTGAWVDVERFFMGICGNSFRRSYNESLQPDQEWLTFVEVYRGSRPTSYRLKCLVRTRSGENSMKYIYSNAIPGTIDDCRFIPRY